MQYDNEAILQEQEVFSSSEPDFQSAPAELVKLEKEACDCDRSLDLAASDYLLGC